jgi:hypothetical protein
MQRRRAFGGRMTSVLDLVDDGADLAHELKKAAAQDGERRDMALAALIEPVIEVCDEEAVCPETGLMLREIWRYFRHTWSLEYRATPGRCLQHLIRKGPARDRDCVAGKCGLAIA